MDVTTVYVSIVVRRGCSCDADAIRRDSTSLHGHETGACGLEVGYGLGLATVRRSLWLSIATTQKKEFGE